MLPKNVSYFLVLWLGLAGFAGYADSTITVRSSVHPVIPISNAIFSAPVDPNKAPSEFNHHVAGWALIGVGLLVLISVPSRDLSALRYVWPVLFLFAGLFLALWSDADIWPRGNLSWAWLVHHDHEAGQHKIYAMLLIAMAVVEYLRACGYLNRSRSAWAFSALAVVGASCLLVHDHSAGSGATSSEARAYFVNPALDQDGHGPALPASDSVGIDHSTMDMEQLGMSMDHSGMDHSSMDHSSMSMGSDPAPTTPSLPGHHHPMTPSMLLVEHEHFWFMIVGLGVALFKLISDCKFWHRRFIPYVWPSGMVVLGILLVFYRE